MAVFGLDYDEVWTLDTEFVQPDGHRPRTVCLVARELGSNRLLRLWEDDLVRGEPPFRIDERTLFVAFFNSAEWSVFLDLDWPLPPHSIDLFVEGRCEVNGQPNVSGSLLATLGRHGLGSITKEEKTDWRDLIMSGGPWSPAERQGILDYCQSDVDCLGPLFEAMLPGIRQRGFERALIRARYMTAVARMERTGVPIDVELLGRIRESWEAIKLALVAEVDEAFGVYEGTTFKVGRFQDYVSRHRLVWPRDDATGRLLLDADTFRDMARTYPQLAPLKELRTTLGELRLESLAVGPDGRNRTLLSPFRARTGRNQPSNSRFIFGPSAWVRHLIVPPPGRSLVYLDWSAQEVSIAAALSGDERMIEAVESGDVYLAFARQAGLVPADATKESHKEERAVCKIAVLGSNYGMTARTLAYRIDRSTIEAAELLRRLRETWRVYFDWREAQVDRAQVYGRIESVLGWPMLVDQTVRPNVVCNFPMQANGAEMLRLAAVLVTEAGIDVAAPVHDALLIDVPTSQLDQAIAETRRLMTRAASIILDGRAMPRIDADIVRSGERFSDGRGVDLFEKVCGLLPSSTSSGHSSAAS